MIARPILFRRIRLAEIDRAVREDGRPYIDALAGPALYARRGRGRKESRVLYKLSAREFHKL